MDFAIIFCFGLIIGLLGPLTGWAIEQETARWRQQRQARRQSIRTALTAYAGLPVYETDPSHEASMSAVADTIGWV